MKKRIPIIIAMIMVLSLLIAMAGPVYAWGFATGEAVADDSGTTSVWSSNVSGTDSAQSRIGAEDMPEGPNVASTVWTGSSPWDVSSTGKASAGIGGARSHIKLTGHVVDGAQAHGTAFAESSAHSRAWAETTHTALDGGHTDANSTAYAYFDSWGPGRPASKAVAVGESTGAGSMTTVDSNAQAGLRRVSDSGHSMATAETSGWSGGGSTADADADANAYYQGRAFAYGTAWADQGSNATADADADDWYGRGGRTANADATARADMNSTATATADADAMYGADADADADATADARGTATALADVDAMYGANAWGDAYADAQFGGTATSIATVTNTEGMMAGGLSEAEASFGSNARAVLTNTNTGGRFSRGGAFAEADFDSTAIAVTEITNDYGGHSGARTTADANFDSTATSSVVVNEAGSSGSTGGGVHSDANFNSDAFAEGRSSTLPDTGMNDPGDIAIGHAFADAIFDSSALASYNAESINDGAATAEANSLAICESDAMTQATAYADDAEADANADALAVAGGIAGAVAMANAEDDGTAQADADAVAALGGDAFSLSMADATSTQVVIDGEPWRVQATDFGSGGAAWAWAFTDGSDVALSGTTSIAIMGSEATAISMADSEEGSMVIAEVTP